MRSCCFHFSVDLLQIFCLVVYILIEYLASVINVVSTNPCVGSLPIIKIPFSLLSLYTDELISAPKIMTCFPMLASGKDNSEPELNPIPWLVHTDISGSAFLGSFAEQNK